MTRLLPRSLLGQVMLALAAALLIAQGISTALLYRAAEQRQEAALLHSVVFELIAGERRADGRDARPNRRDGERRGPPRGRFRQNMRDDDMPTYRLPRRLRYSESAHSPLLPGEAHDIGREDALSDLLERYGVDVGDLAVAERPATADPAVTAAMADYPELRAIRDPDAPDLLVVGMQRAGSDEWQIVRMPLRGDNRVPLITMMVQTFVLFIILVGLMYLVLRRITGPLHVLAQRTQRFAATGEPEPPLPPTGPDDVSRLISAHNAMQARIGAMLDEKDVMLGAIGHDLKTPLAALRVRVESVEDDAARQKMVATIEDITRTLDEILALARVGRADAPPERTDLGALAASVVEEFEDMGEPVVLLDFERIIAPVHLTWLKRGLRNLVSNALRYAGVAEVSILREGGEAILRVDDFGPGIPENRIADMLEPFTRGEASRNRETGGAGLGLTLARAVAEQHGGTLVLTNRPEGGLRAEIRIPV